MLSANLLRIFLRFNLINDVGSWAGCPPFYVATLFQVFPTLSFCALPSLKSSPCSNFLYTYMDSVANMLQAVLPLCVR